jgi:hypothetical protein
MPDEQWYALESGEQRGPFTRAALTARIGAGAPVALVWRDGMTGWAPPRDVAELGLRHPVRAVPPSFVDAFRAVAQSYGAAVQSDGDTHRFDTSQADLVVRVSLTAERDDDEATLEIERLGVPYPELTIRQEDGLDRAGKRFGIDREVQVHDDALDRAAYFETALPAPAVRDIVGRPGFRQALDRWLQRDADWVVLDQNGLSVQLPLKRVDALTRELVDAELAAVAQAADALRGLDRGLERHRRPSWPGWTLLLGILGALVGLPGVLIADAFWEPVSAAPYLLGIGGGVALAAAVVGAMAVLLRGQSGTFSQVVYSGVVLLAALPSLGTAGLLTANGVLDRGGDVVRQTVVRRRDTERERRMASYFFGRARYRTRHVLVTVEGSRTRRIPVAESVWRETAVGAPLRVRVRPGTLGWEWDPRAE